MTKLIESLKLLIVSFEALCLLLLIAALYYYPTVFGQIGSQFKTTMTFGNFCLLLLSQSAAFYTICMENFKSAEWHVK